MEDFAVAKKRCRTFLSRAQRFVKIMGHVLIINSISGADYHLGCYVSVNSSSAHPHTDYCPIDRGSEIPTVYDFNVPIEEDAKV